jgi:hypothetical protein
MNYKALAAMGMRVGLVTVNRKLRELRDKVYRLANDVRD